MNVTSITFIAYLVAMIGISVVAARYAKNSAEEYYLGGRSMGPFATALSAAASGRSGGTMLGHAGMAYLMGIHAAWVGVGFCLVDFIGMKYLGPRLRRYTERHDCITLPDFFASRFRHRADTVRWLSAGIIFIFMMTYLASQLLAMGFVFTAVLGWSSTLGILIAAFAVATYCFLGGYTAVVWTDVVQAILMILALVVLPIVGVAHLGGMQSVMEQLRAIDATFISVVPDGRFMWVVGIVFGTGLMQFGLVHTVTRWMSVRSVEALEQAAPINLIANTIITWGGLFIGWIGRIMVPDLANVLGQNREMIFFDVTADLLPPVIAGIAVSAVFAAIMSTADSQVMVASSSLVHDLYQRLIRKGEALTDRQVVWGGRLSILVLMAGAFVWAMFATEGVFLLTIFAGAVLAGGVGILLVLSLIWRRITASGAIAGMVAGPLTAILWKVTDLSAVISEALVAFVVGGLAIYVVSLMTPAPDGNEVDAIVADMS
ncbi:MAG: sodium/proline symporter [Planctomycetes bacterium]|nr:sodium/proline symporter [Planctomycetota bacterium]